MEASIELLNLRIGGTQENALLKFLDVVSREARTADGFPSGEPSAVRVLSYLEGVVEVIDNI